MSIESEALDVAQRVLDADNGRDAARYRSLLHDDYRAEVNGATGATNAEAEVAALESTWAGFSDGRTELIEMWASGNKVTLRYRLVGTQDRPWRGSPPSNRKIDVAGCTILEVIDAKVKRVWRYFDVLGFMGQLGMSSDSPPAAPAD